MNEWQTPESWGISVSALVRSSFLGLPGGRFCSPGSRGGRQQRKNRRARNNDATAAQQARNRAPPASAAVILSRRLRDGVFLLTAPPALHTRTEQKPNKNRTATEQTPNRNRTDAGQVPDRCRTDTGQNANSMCVSALKPFESENDWGAWRGRFQGYCVLARMTLGRPNRELPSRPSCLPGSISHPE